MEMCLAESSGKLLLEGCRAKFNSKLSGAVPRAGPVLHPPKGSPEVPAMGTPPHARFGHDGKCQQSQSSAGDI